MTCLEVLSSMLQVNCTYHKFTLQNDDVTVSLSQSSNHGFGVVFCAPKRPLPLSKSLKGNQHRSYNMNTNNYIQGGGLTWNVKMIVSKFGISYSNWCNFQVNLVKLWEGNWMNPYFHPEPWGRWDQSFHQYIFSNGLVKNHHLPILSDLFGMVK